MSEAPFIPENAPFAPAQRAWLNGFFAGLVSAEAPALAAAPAAATPEEDFPWHDPTLPLEERMKLAEGRALQRRMMAAMGQLDCGQCGYLCKEYAEAIAAGAEKDLGRCVPGGKPTAKKLKEILKAEGGPAVAAVAPPKPPAAPEHDKGLHRDAPVQARLLESAALTSPGCARAVRHVRLALEVPYAPGDSLGVWVRNNPEEVELILGLLDARGSEPVALDDGRMVSAREALSRHCDLRVPTASLYLALAKFARAAREAAVLARFAEDDAGAHRLGIHEVLNTLTRFPSARPPVGEFAAALGRLQPRLYSIASSPRAHPGEVHLTIAVVSYELFARNYRGLASNFFAERLRPGLGLPVYVQRAHAFSLPADDAPLVMIGPGTGVAPFRAFLEERAARGATGRNWLFFGNQRRDLDYLYAAELEAWRAQGLLTRLDTAFSREQAHKVYVQDRMREQGAELWRWLEEGARVYVCGDAQRMARDVDLALRAIVAEHGGMAAEKADAYLAVLAAGGRYCRDVY